jgi:hypothetical protein
MLIAERAHFPILDLPRAGCNKGMGTKFAGSQHPKIALP